MQEKASTSNLVLKRAFVRSVVRSLSGGADGAHEVQVAVDAAQAQLCASVRELSRLSTQSGGAIDWASVFVNVLPPVRLDGGSEDALSALRRAVAAAVTQQAAELRAAGTAEWIVRLVGDTGCAWRVHVAMPSGAMRAPRVLTSSACKQSNVRVCGSNVRLCGFFVVHGAQTRGRSRPGHEFGEGTVSIYKEEASEQGAVQLLQQGQSESPPDTRVGGGVEPLSPLQQRRLHARRHKTTYCYDFPAVFENALHSLWTESAARGGAPPPARGDLVRAAELGLAGRGDFREAGAELREIERGAGSNDVGIVAWRLTLRTPEWPEGRDVVVVANDITFRAGAFGPDEHAVFRAVCDHALAARLPLLYLAANSGARVGLDQALKRRLRVRPYSFPLHLPTC